MKSPCISLLSAAIAASLLSCAGCRFNVNNPLKSDDPWPQPHTGVFVSGADTLTFNGDGESVSWHFAEGMNSVGLQGSGTYAFLFDGGLWRYDAAERLDIFTAEGRQISLGLGVPGSCSDSVICLRRFDLPGREAIDEVFRLTK